MAWVGRKYKLDKSENFSDYMKALGKPHFFRFLLLMVESYGFSFDLKNTPAKSHHIRPSEVYAVCEHRLLIIFYYFFVAKVNIKRDLQQYNLNFFGFAVLFSFSYNTYGFFLMCTVTYATKYYNHSIMKFI